MNISMDNKTHTYIVDGDIASISVTELLHKHGLAPDYSKIPKRMLNASAKRGTLIHKDIEDYINNLNYVPTTKQGNDFKEWSDKHIDCAVAEQMVAYDYNGMIVCGTADIVGITKDEKYFVGDHKTTATFQREYVSWQVSILDYFLRKLEGQTINGKPINWKSADKFYCFWYKEEEDLVVKELDKIPDCEIERLLDCEFHNTKYQRYDLVLEEETKNAIEQAELYLAQVNEMQKIAEQKAKELRCILLEQMQKQNIKYFATDKIRISYVEAMDRTSVDSKKLKELYPKAYSECLKITGIAPQVRIKIKENEFE